MYEDFQIVTKGLDNDEIYFYVNDLNRSVPRDYAFKVSCAKNALYVTVSCDYKDKLCGLLGNYNGVKEDDWMTKNGTVINRPDGPRMPSNTELWDATWEFGDSWRLDSIPYCPTDVKDVTACSPDQVPVIEAKCDVLYSNSAISSCKQDLANAYQACLYDLCFTPEAEWDSLICQLVEDHERTCKTVGIELSEWRTPTFCPYVCPDPRMTYNKQASVCFETTANCNTYETRSGIDFYRNAFTRSLQTQVCSSETAPRCECPTNYPIYNIQTGKCTATCVEPVIIEPKCQGHGRGAGDVHYYTFDGEVADFQGNCEYTLSKLCYGEHNNTNSISGELPWFRISGKQDAVKQWFIKGVTWLSFVRVQYRLPYSNTTIEIKKGVPGWGRSEAATIKIGDAGEMPLLSPYVYAEHKIVVSGSQATEIYFGVDDLESIKPEKYKFKISISKFAVDVMLDCVYENKVCGILGNFDNDKSNDWVNHKTNEVMVKPGGSRSPTNKPLWDATWVFGKSWLVDELEECELDNNTDVDMCSEADAPEIASLCSAFVSKAFVGCDVNREEEIVACEYDLCFTPKDQWSGTLCHLLESYENTCNQAGLTIPEWRNETFCPYVCPQDNMIYNKEASVCYPTTANCETFNTTVCPSIVEARCECPDDFPIWDVILGRCTDECEFEEPEVPEYCYSIPAGMSGDPHYHSFDNTYFDYQGKCDYTVTKICNSTESNQFSNFEIVVDQDQHEEDDANTWNVTFIRGITVITEELTFNNKKFNPLAWTATNNSVTIPLPLNHNFPEQNIAVRKMSDTLELYIGVNHQGKQPDWSSKVNSFIEDFLVKVQYSPNNDWMNVQLNCELKGHVCGLLGNYNDNPNDESPGPYDDKKEWEKEFGDSFLFGHAQDSTCEKTGPSPVMPCEKYDDYINICEKIDAAPFDHCRVPREQTIKNCAYDMCVGLDPEKVVCDMMQKYVSDCNDFSKSDRIESWRTDDRCSASFHMNCMPGQVYKSCENPVCYPTVNYCEIDIELCNNEKNDEICKEGCYCESGLFENSVGQCVDECESLLPVFPVCYSPTAYTVNDCFVSFDGEITCLEDSCDGYKLVETGYLSDRTKFFLIWYPDTRGFELTLGDNLIKIDETFTFDSVPSVRLDLEQDVHAFHVYVGGDSNENYDLHIVYSKLTENLAIDVSCDYKKTQEFYLSGVFGDYDENRSNDAFNVSDVSFGSGCEIKPCETQSNRTECINAYHKMFDRMEQYDAFMSACEHCGGHESCPIFDIISQFDDSMDSDLINEICEDYNPCSGNQTFELCGSGQCIITIENCYDLESNPLICPPGLCVPGCYCNNGFIFDTTENKCISEELCPAPINMIMNVTKPCCESDSLPTERPPLVGLIIFTQNITATVESPCCESEYLPSTRPPVTGPITFIDSDEEFTGNMEKPCCETESMPSSRPPSVGPITFVNDDQILIGDIQKPCCESEYIPSTRPPTVGPINFVDDSTIILNIQKPCCESESIPSVNPPNVGFIYFDMEEEITLIMDIPKPCCESASIPSDKPPTVGEIHFDFVTDFVLDIEKPCCESESIPSDKPPTVGEINFVYDDFVLDISKPCCESNTIPSVLKPTVSEILLEFKFNITMDLERPCCESQQIPSDRPPSVNEINFEPFDFLIDVEMPCCESDSLPSEKPPNVGEINFENNFNIQLDVQKPCCESQSIPSEKPPSIDELFLEFVEDNIKLDVEKPCCESETIPSVNGVNQEVNFDWSFPLDVSTPCCETVTIPSATAPETADVKLTYDYSDQLVNITKAHPCCNDQYSTENATSVCESYETVFDVYTDNLVDLCNATPTGSRKRRSIERVQHKSENNYEADYNGWSSWSAWAPCHETPKSVENSVFSSQSRQRVCYGQNCVGSASETRDNCGLQRDWSSWSDCSSVTKYRHRKRIGINMKDKVELIPCALSNTELGRFSEWSEWSECDVKSCDSIGKQMRTRQCLGRTCIGETFASKDCKVACEKSERSNKPGRGLQLHNFHPVNSDISYSFAIGNFSYLQNRDICASRQQYELNHASELGSEFSNVIPHSHSALDLQVAQIAHFVKETGFETKYFWTGLVENESQNTKSCERISFTPKSAWHVEPSTGANITTISVETESSYVDCKISMASILCVSGKSDDWSDWSECSKPCGTGQQYRTTVCTSGKSCNMQFESKECNNQSCEKRCVEEDRLACWTADCSQPRVAEKCPLTCKLERCDGNWMDAAGVSQVFIDP